jgi:hypothetical protein
MPLTKPVLVTVAQNPEVSFGVSVLSALKVGPLLRTLIRPLARSRALICYYVMRFKAFLSRLCAALYFYRRASTDLKH